MLQLRPVQGSCQLWTSASTAAPVDAQLALTDVPSPCCSFKDREVQRDSKLVSYDVVDKKGKPYVSVDVAGETKVFSPEEISAMILTKMKDTAGGLEACRAGCWSPWGLHGTAHSSLTCCPFERHNSARAMRAGPPLSMAASASAPACL